MYAVSWLCNFCVHMQPGSMCSFMKQIVCCLLQVCDKAEVM